MKTTRNVLIILAIITTVVLFMQKQETSTLPLVRPSIVKERITVKDIVQDQKIVSSVKTPEAPPKKELISDEEFINNEINFAIQELDRKELILCDFEDVKVESLYDLSAQDHSLTTEQLNIAYAQVCKNQNSLEVIPQCLTVKQYCRNYKSAMESDLLTYMTADETFIYIRNREESMEYIKNPPNPEQIPDAHWDLEMERLKKKQKQLSSLDSIFNQKHISDFSEEKGKEFELPSPESENP
mgnify:CR=1 FL=1